MRPPLISTDMGSSLLYDEFKLALVALSPSRTVAELKELRELTGNEDGAQRVAWTDTWETARAWLRDKLAALPLEHEIDEAGNQWWTLRGASKQAVLIGGHIDSVPNGGWVGGAPHVGGGGEGVRGLAGEGEAAGAVRVGDVGGDGGGGRRAAPRGAA